MYLTYEQYRQYGGTLDETTFGDFEFEARTQVDWYTFNRLQKETTFPEAVTRCMYKLIQLLQRAAEAGQISSDVDDEAPIQAAISSQSNDGVSVSYNLLSAKDVVDTVQDDIKLAVNHYLSGVINSLGQKVLYRGTYPNE